MVDQVMRRVSGRVFISNLIKDKAIAIALSK